MKHLLRTIAAFAPRISLAVLLLPVVTAVKAQVSLYEFTESSGTYTEITEEDGGVFLGVPTYWPHVFNSRAWVNNPFNDPDGQVTQSGSFNAASGPGYPIGFDFTFNGDVFDRIGISNGGWIGFGKSSDNLQAVWVYNDAGSIPFAPTYNNPTPNYKRNRVAGFGNGGLQLVNWSSLLPPGQVSRLQMTTIGTAPNRVCVIQWKDFGLRNDVTVAMNKVNFQIRLNEVDNSVEVVFGPQTWVSTIGRQVRTQSGLGGRTSDDFNGRMTVYEQPAFLYDWNNTVRAVTNEDVCTFAITQTGMPAGSGIPPATGLTWRWQPPVCPPPAWPFVISDITFASAVATWQTSPAGEYEYFVSTENSVTGPEVASGITNDPEAAFEELEPGTRYYVFVRSICDGTPGVWSTSVQFVTLKGGVIACDGGVETELYCSNQHSTEQWLYYSADGSPLRLEFLGGYAGSISGESFGVWLDGAPISGAPTRTFSGNLAGQFVQSSTGQIYIRYTTAAGACTAQDWYLPIEWRVGCKNCSDPQALFIVEEDCANAQYSVVVDIWSLGSATELRLENSLGVAPLVVSTTGRHTVGPFPAGSAVVVNVQNAENAMCYMQSAVMINEPCAIVDCGPTYYTYCYGDNEWTQRAYQGADGQQIGIRFLRGTVGFGDVGRIYNGADPNMAPTPVSIAAGGGPTNKLFVSGTPSSDRTLVLELVSDASHSCAEADPLYGTSQEWEYVVACYDGCLQPKASFATVCVDPSQFEVAVNITDIGSSGSVTITNTGGAPPVTATAVGTYTVGPFAGNVPVDIHVEGASVLCTWSGIGLTKDCLTMAVDEVSAGELRLFPNPNDGRFSLTVPAAFTGGGLLEVRDLAGRLVASERIVTQGVVDVQLQGLPSGLYTVRLSHADGMLNGRVIIQ